MNFGAIILAAGLSSRMGAFKPLLQLGDRTLLAHCLGLFQSFGIRPCVVVGHRGDEVRCAVEGSGAVCCENPDFKHGMLSSIQAAFRSIPRFDGIFLLPVDIPLIRPATLSLLIDRFDGRTAVIPTFAGHRGHPPLLPGRYAAEIIAYAGAGGLEGFLEGRIVSELPVWDKGTVLDADNADDFTALKYRLSRLAIGDREEALALAALTMPPRGLAHGKAVAAAALVIGQRLRARGLDLDLDLIHNAALLHDIAKGSPLHELQGGRLLADLGLPGLADIVMAHRNIGPSQTGQVGEKEVVGLADKYVRGCHLVPLRKRYEEKLNRFAGDRDACTAIKKRLKRAELLREMVEQQLGSPIETILMNETAGKGAFSRATTDQR